MTDTRDSEPAPCSDIDPADLIDQGLDPEMFHDLQEVTREVISDRSCCKVAVVEEECSRCSNRIFGIRLLGDGPELMQHIKWMVYDTYEAIYEDPRSVQHVDMGQHIVELGQEAVVELCKSLLLAAGFAHNDAEKGADKRSKQDIWTQVFGPEFTDGD